MLKTANEQPKSFLMKYRAYLDQRLEQTIARAAWAAPIWRRPEGAP